MGGPYFFCQRQKKYLPVKKAKKATSRAGPAAESAHQQVGQYDKILRENMEFILPGLIKNLLGIHAVHMEELPDDVQHTKERKPDVLKKFTDERGETFVLHVELQIADEKEMVYRMAEYYVMLLRRYQLPVHQYVIYLGESVRYMTDHLVSEQMHFKYRLMVLSAIDYRLLLSADDPREKMLAILGGFGDRDRRQVAESIVKEVFTASTGDFSQRRNLQQLLIFSKLRKLAPEITAIMESFTTWWKLERDPFYLKGEERGKEEKTLEVAKSLLLNTHHTIPEIARLINVSEAFVRKVKRSMRS